MHIHIHQPKTAGTTFNFGIANVIFNPSELLIAGTDFPLKNLGELQSRQLQQKEFLSGHFNQLYLKNYTLRKTISNQNLIFGFVRHPSKILPSLINQLEKTKTENLVEKFHEYVSFYIDGCKLIQAHQGLLLRSNDHREFAGALELLREVANYPIVSTSPRNVRVKGLHENRNLKFAKSEFNTMLELFHSGIKTTSSSHNNIPSQDCITGLPSTYTVEQEIRGRHTLRVDSANRLLIWISNPKVTQIEIKVNREWSFCERRNVEKRGLRRDIFEHAPYLKSFELNAPFGFPITNPCKEVIIESNRKENEIIGRLISYRLKFTRDK